MFSFTRPRPTDFYALLTLSLITNYSAQLSIGEDLAPSLGDVKNVADHNFSTTFKEQISIFMPKIYDDLFIVIDRIVQVFSPTV